MSVNSRSIGSNPNDETRRLLGLGLTSTSPYFISDTALHDLTTAPGYVLYVLETATINAASVHNVTGNSFDGVTLEPGLYHIVFKQIQLDGGVAIVYRTTPR